MKKLILFVFGLFLFLVLATPLQGNAQTSTTSQFLDVASIHPNYGAISYLRARGLLAGYDDGSFLPFSKLKRSQLVVMIVEAKGVTPDKNLYKNWLLKLQNNG